MSEPVLPDFPDVNLVATILLEKNKFNAPDIATLKSNPEFQVFRIIGQNKIIGTDEIEAKFQSQSLSMILSNLQADNLIEQSSDYRWKVNPVILNLLVSNEEEQHKQSEEEIEREQQIQKMKERNAKKALYKRIADQLVGSGYVPEQHTVEDLFDIPEVEILTLIFEHEPINADEIDQKMNLDTSVSLALSNLSADGLIKQNENYQWILTQELSSELKQISSSRPDESESKEGSTTSMGYDPNQNKIIEHKQLLKAILDINYFGNKKLQEILETPEFEILNIINSNSPIGSDEIEEKLTQETLLSLIISNLSADGLIEQSNDYRYVLAEDFRIRVSKVKVSQQEIMEQLRKEQAQMAQPVDQTDEKTTNSEINKFTTSPSNERENTLPDQSSSTVNQTTKTDPIATQLQKYGYIQDTSTPVSELQKLPEYEILKLLSQRQPLSSDELDEASNSSSVSMTLSNLGADGLIKQREADFKYELAGDLEEYQSRASKTTSLSESSNSVSTTSPTPTPEMEDTSDSQKVEGNKHDITPTHRSQFDDKNQPTDKDIEKLKVAVEKAGYVEDSKQTLEEMMKISEFEVLKIIGDHQPVDEDMIKQNAESVSPVLVSRTLSKLEAEDRISRSSDGKWEYSENFNNLLIEDELKEKERQTKLEEERKRREREAREKEERARREKFISLLKQEGIIEEASDHDKLMRIPEFEILWIISEGEDGITEEEIKEKAKSTSPVMVTRTIGQLDAKGRIQRTLSGKYELSPDLKDLTS